MDRRRAAGPGARLGPGLELVEDVAEGTQARLQLTPKGDGGSRAASMRSTRGSTAC